MLAAVGVGIAQPLVVLLDVRWVDAPPWVYARRLSNGFYVRCDAVTGTDVVGVVRPVGKVRVVSSDTYLFHAAEVCGLDVTPVSFYEGYYSFALGP